MHVFAVTLISRTDGAMQTIHVESLDSSDMQEYVNRIADLQIKDPVVVDIQPTTLRIQRP